MPPRPSPWPSLWPRASGRPEPRSRVHRQQPALPALHAGPLPDGCWSARRTEPSASGRLTRAWCCQTSRAGWTGTPSASRCPPGPATDLNVRLARRASADEVNEASRAGGRRHRPVLRNPVRLSGRVRGLPEADGASRADLLAATRLAGGAGPPGCRAGAALPARRDPADRAGGDLRCRAGRAVRGGLAAGRCAGSRCLSAHGCGREAGCCAASRSTCPG